MRRIASSCEGLNVGKVRMARPPLGTKFAISLLASMPRDAKSRNAAPNMALRIMVILGASKAESGDGDAGDGADTTKTSCRSFTSLFALKSL